MVRDGGFKQGKRVEGIKHSKEQMAYGLGS